MAVRKVKLTADLKFLKNFVLTQNWQIKQQIFEIIIVYIFFKSYIFFLLFAFHNFKINALQGVTQARSQRFAVWGGILEAGNNIKRSWPRLWSVFDRIESVFVAKYWWSPTKKKVSTKIGTLFLSKFAWSQKKKKKKKKSSARLKPMQFFVRNHIWSLTNYHRQYHWGGGGGYFRF